MASGLHPEDLPLHKSIGVIRCIAANSFVLGLLGLAKVPRVSGGQHMAQQHKLITHPSEVQAYPATIATD